MTSTLPLYIDVARLAANRSRLQGGIEPEKFTRITGEVSLVEPVSVVLEFELKEGGRPEISGELHGHAEGICQRCLERVRFALDATLSYEVVDEYRHLSEAGSVVFDLLTFLEDECILAFPITVTHPIGSCVPPGDSSLIAGGGSNPFDVLTTLRQNKP
jgi:uncharacterized metal-binding protein YceD (DUF177 family)